MSLQVWLPFNNNINNKGVANGISGSAAYVGGFVTQYCKSTGTVTIPAAIMTNICADHKATIAFWYKANLSGSNTIICGTSSQGASNNRNLSFFQYPNVDDLHYAFMNEGETTTYAGGLVEDVFTDGNFHHICVVNNTGLVSLYIDGKFRSKSGKLNSWISTVFYNYTITNESGYINDFRLYDNCLSKREITELSKGLMLHYKLCQSTDNLLKNSGYYQSVYYSDSRTDAYSCYPIYCNGLTVGREYTLSCECDGELFVHTSNQNPANKYFTVWLYQDSTEMSESNYKHYTTPTCFSKTNLTKQVGNKYMWVFTPVYPNVSFRFNGYADGTNKETVTFSNIKLEEGAVETDWMPHRADNAYYLMGYSNAAHSSILSLKEFTLAASTDNWNYKTFNRSSKYPVGTYGLHCKVSKLAGSFTSVTFLFYDLSNNVGYDRYNLPIDSQGYINANITLNTSCPDFLIYAGYAGSTANNSISVTELSLTLYTGIEHDSSGYDNHGSVLTPIYYEKGSPRYKYYSYFNSTGSGVFGSRKCGDLSTVTLSFWAKFKTIKYNAIFGNWESGGFGIYTDGNGYIYFEYWDGSAYKSINSTQPIEVNKWYMITGVYDFFNKKIYLYLNGKLVNFQAVDTLIKIGSASNVPLSIGNPNPSGVSTISDICLSDIRVYATAFSPSEVKKMYNTVASLANNGTLLCMEIVDDKC